MIAAEENMTEAYAHSDRAFEKNKTTANELTKVFGDASESISTLLKPNVETLAGDMKDAAPYIVGVTVSLAKLAIAITDTITKITGFVAKSMSPETVTNDAEEAHAKDILQDEENTYFKNEDLIASLKAGIDAYEKKKTDDAKAAEPLKASGEADPTAKIHPKTAQHYDTVQTMLMQIHTDLTLQNRPPHTPVPKTLDK
jgi:hypothetical protein